MMRRMIILFLGCYLLLNVFGCEAFVRKFTRKPKKDGMPKEEMVLSPEEYKSDMTKEERYRQYLLYWKSWQDELIESLAPNSNHKKQVGCIDEAIKNLEQLAPLLNPQKQKGLDGYINQLKGLKNLIAQDVYGNSIIRSRSAAERIKRNILRDFSYDKIKDSLI